MCNQQKRVEEDMLLFSLYGGCGPGNDILIFFRKKFVIRYSSSDFLSEIVSFST
jgi:hypothetical protein